MIKIYTSCDGERHFVVPQALVDVAVELFGADPNSAIFSLARGLTADNLATCERIALAGEHAQAVAFARAQAVKRPVLN